MRTIRNILPSSHKSYFFRNNVGANRQRIDLCGATPHVFRHTYITLAASSGMDVKTLQSIAGHSDIKMTLDRYAHERENNIISAGSLIGDVFRSM